MPVFKNIKIKNKSKTLFLWPTTTEEIENVILTTTKKTPTSGIDQVSGKVVKEVRSLIAKPLSYLISESFSHGCFPS